MGSAAPVDSSRVARIAILRVAPLFGGGSSGSGHSRCRDRLQCSAMGSARNSASDQSATEPNQRLTQFIRPSAVDMPAATSSRERYCVVLGFEPTMLALAVGIVLSQQAA